MRGSRRLAALLLAAACTALTLAPRQVAAAGRLCGYLESGGHPIRGASILAAGEGRVAHSDSAGLFCLDGLRNATQRLQILALGFAPVERFLPVGAETLLVELVPLRTLSTASVAPARRASRSRDMRSDLPEFVQYGDSSLWITGPAELRHLHALLSDSALVDSVTTRGSWRAVCDLVTALQQRLCPTTTIQVRECDYLRRAEVVAWARAAVVEEDGDTSRRAREALAELRKRRSETDLEAWAARIEARLPH